MRNLCFFLMIIVSAKTQDLTVGVKYNSSFSRLFYNSNTTAVLDFKNGVSLPKPAINLLPSMGVFVRKDFKKSMALLEINQNAINIGHFYFASDNPYSVYTNRRVGMLNLELLYGYKPMPWLRLNAGLGVNFSTKTFRPDEQFYYGSKKRIFDADLNANVYVDDFSAEGIEKYQTAKIDQVKNEVFSSYYAAINKSHLNAKLGIGFDIGGFMIDLNYTKSMSPIIGNIDFKGEVFKNKSNYDYFSLNVGYRFLPIKKFLVKPSDNATLKKIKSEIKYQKNEVSFNFGKSISWWGQSSHYENAYTHFFANRLGIGFGINKSSQSLKNYFINYQLYGLQQTLGAFTELKYLALYTKKHRIGLAGGLNIKHSTGFQLNNQEIDPDILRFSKQKVPFTSVYSNVSKPFGFGVQATANYIFLITDHIGIGAWYRISLQSNQRFGNLNQPFGVKTSLFF
jgi:hypothetical protein